MSSRGSQTAVIALTAVVSALGTLLAAQWLQGAARPAFAQVSSQGSADYIVGLVGPAKDVRVPLFLIDTKQQKIVIYEYDNSRRFLYLRVVRNFQYDRQFDDRNFGEANMNEGPSVDEVRKILASPQGASRPAKPAGGTPGGINY